MNGGYVNIDASGLDVHETEKQTINGIYKKILDAKKADKPIFVYNAVFGDYGKMSPIGVFCNFASDGKTIICTSSTLQIIVDENDGVTINNMITE
ncbi:MAG: hypothetical protein J6U02_00535 [Elusimicrobia bacterium]|nr:hypothetical protein [Elusimicrobiota bacterium]